MMALMAVKFMSYSRGECGFSSLESWFCSKEWVWKLGTKKVLHWFREVKCQQGNTS